MARSLRHRPGPWAQRLLLLVSLTPLVLLNPGLADPLQELQSGFCSGCALRGQTCGAATCAACT